MYYFASDIHLGHGTPEESRKREKLFVSWLEKVSVDAKAIFLVGDVFDFWYEYRRVVPKGFTRFLGKLSELTDRGIEIHFFTGNHDMWRHDYLSKECGAVLHSKQEVFELYGKNVSVVHGDEIYAANLRGAKFINAIFRSRFLRLVNSCFVHPNLTIKFGNWWSNSRKSKEIKMPFRGERDFMVREAIKQSKTSNIDYFIFGHNHCAEDFHLPQNKRVLFLGQWFDNPVYGALSPDGEICLKPVEQ